VLRRVVTGALLFGLAAGAAAPARAATQVLMPGVTYSRQMQFTAHGPVAIHVLTAPKPGGLYALRPILSNGTIVGRERVTSMQKDVSDSATVAGVNGDLFNWRDGHPTGILMQNGVLQSPPYRSRSSIGIAAATGKLTVGRVAFYGYWQGLGQRRPLTGLNQPPRGDGTSLFTPVWGARTPTVPGATEAVIEPFPPATVGDDLSGVVVTQTSGGGTPIPRDGAVLVAHGSQASKLLAEAPPPARVVVHIVLRPDWTAAGITDALGGGPVIVRNGRAVYTAGEDFLPSQIAPRNPRTGVGQRRDGKIVMVVVDGRQPGYSVGLTNFELAQTLVRFGAVTGSALDAGGSSTLAFDGKLLNRPSDPTGERAVAETLAVMYTGVYAPPPALSVISPNGDGIDERQSLSFKVVRPSTVTANIFEPDGTSAYSQVGPRLPGAYRVSWPGARAKGRLQTFGRWRWVVSATDDLGRTSSVERAFWVNDTLGFLRVSPKAVRLRARRANSIVARFQLAHTARVTGSIWARSGVLVRRLRPVTLKQGRRALRWNGRYASGRLAYRGGYVFKVFAQNAFGPAQLAQAFVVVR
jgi:Phosphodiester glycosidase